MATKKYCICNKPYKGEFMVECSNCKEWYHPACINEQDTPKKDFKGSWKCFNCFVPNNKRQKSEKISLPSTSISKKRNKIVKKKEISPKNDLNTKILNKKQQELKKMNKRQLLSEILRLQILLDTNEENNKGDDKSDEASWFENENPLELGWINKSLEDESTHSTMQTIETISSPDYWLSLCPWLHVNNSSFVMEVQKGWQRKSTRGRKTKKRKKKSDNLTQQAEKVCEECKHNFEHEGYCTIGLSDTEKLSFAKERGKKKEAVGIASNGIVGGVDYGFSMELLAKAIATLVRHGWHPIWVVMYDEAWLLPLRLLPFVRRIVGEKLYFNGDFWAWYIDPTNNDSGWEIHRDRQGISPLSYVTTWVAMTDATPTNSCIYVVPSHHDPDYNTRKDSTDFDINCIRAVPVSSGTALMWSGRTLHFGGKSSNLIAETPRISISFAYSTHECEEAEMRLGDYKFEETNSEGVTTLPTLYQRLNLVSVLLWMNSHRVPLSDHILKLLEDLEDIGT